MTKVINLFGGPGVGKSTIAAGLFYNMKIAGYNVEAPQEWCKQKVYEGTKYPFKDQLYTYACQNKLITFVIFFPFIGAFFIIWLRAHIPRCIKSCLTPTTPFAVVFIKHLSIPPKFLYAHSTSHLHRSNQSGHT